MEDIDSGMGEDNPCHHITTEITCDNKEYQYFVLHTVAPAGVVIEGVLQGTGTNVTDGIARHSSLHIAPTNLVDKWHVPDYRGDAWASMYPEIKSKLSAINSIYELKDFKSVWQQFNTTANRLKRILASGSLPKEVSALMPYSPYATQSGWIKRKQYRKVPLHGLMRQLSKIGTGDLLAWEFAIQPFLQDLTALQRAKQGLEDALKRLLENQNTPLRSHYYKSLHPSEVGIDLVDLPPPSGNGLNRIIFSKVILGTVDYHASVRYKYHFPPEYAKHALRRAALDALGIQMNPGIIWRAIPWSFVVDWFLGIGKSLDKLKVRNLEPIIEILGASNSVKYKVQSQIWSSPDTSNSPDFEFIGLGVRPIVTMTSDVYVRKPFTPVMLSLPHTSDFSFNEMVLAGALGGANLL